MRLTSRSCSAPADQPREPTPIDLRDDSVLDLQDVVLDRLTDEFLTRRVSPLATEDDLINFTD